MIYYRLKEFCQSRLGHITLFTLAVAGMFTFLAGKFKSRAQSEEEASARLPKLPPETLWMDPQEPATTPEINTSGDFTLSERNETFRPFRPIAPKPSVQQPVVRAGTTPQPEETVFPLPSLIQFERPRGQAPADQPILLPKPDQSEPEPGPPALDVKEGALLFCELTAPVSSDGADAPVLASLTRPLVRGATVILPRGTGLSGSLQRGQGNRLLFAREWRVELPSGEWSTLNAQAQEAAFDQKAGSYMAGDGRAGIPARVIAAPKRSQGKLWARTLGTVATAAARLGQDRARTAFGEFVPGTARNVLLQGSSNVVEHFTEPSTNDRPQQQTVLSAQAGQPFYLVVLQ